MDKKVIEGNITYVEVTKAKFLELDEVLQNMVLSAKRKSGHKNPIYLKITDDKRIEIITSKEAAKEIRLARTETRKVLFEKAPKRKLKPWEIR